MIFLTKMVACSK